MKLRGNNFETIWSRNILYYSYEGFLFFGSKTHPPQPQTNTNTNHKHKITWSYPPQPLITQIWGQYRGMVEYEVLVRYCYKVALLEGNWLNFWYRYCLEDSDKVTTPNERKTFFDADFETIWSRNYLCFVLRYKYFNFNTKWYTNVYPMYCN